MKSVRTKRFWSCGEDDIILRRFDIAHRHLKLDKCRRLIPARQPRMGQTLLIGTVGDLYYDSTLHYYGNGVVKLIVIIIARAWD